MAARWRPIGRASGRRGVAIDRGRCRHDHPGDHGFAQRPRPRPGLGAAACADLRRSLSHDRGCALMGSITRTLSFFSKWLAEVFRQPSLMLTLVVGPFLLLLAFG